MFSIIVKAVKVVVVWIMNLPHFALWFSGIGVIFTAIWANIKLVAYLQTKLVELTTELQTGLGGVNAPSASIPAFLAKANYILPLNEMFYLFGLYVGLVATCLTIRGLTAAYRLIPFKAS